MRVIVAEDSMLTRAGIVQVLTDAGVEVVDQVVDAEPLLRLVAQHRPDAVIVDIRMPPSHTQEGLVAAEDIHAAFPGVGVLVLSQYVESRYALRLIEGNPEGAGYLLKDRVMDPAVLVDALRRICEGETVVDPTIVARLMGRKRRNDPLAELTPRELEVLASVAEGLTNHAIAERLVITDRTVEKHMAQIFAKLGLDESPDQHRRVLAVLALLRA
jgi:DNA-binding NarL/FixJ family response regulator